MPCVEAGAHLLVGTALEPELAEPIVDGAESLLGKCDVGSRGGDALERDRVFEAGRGLCGPPAEP